MPRPEAVVLLWSVVGAAVAVLAAMIVIASWLGATARRRRVAAEETLRPLLLAVLGGATHAACLAACLREPHAACTLLARHAWLVRGAWADRLRGLVATPELLSLLRRYARRPTSPAGGLALQLLGFAQRAEDLPHLAALAAGGTASADAAAVGLARGWRFARPEVITALIGLEVRRPDLLRSLVPHLDRADVAHWLAGRRPDEAGLALALFLAGRLDLDADPALVEAGCGAARAQVRRAACLAVRHAAQRSCLPRLHGLVESDPEVQVRVAALRALGRLPDPASLPLLRRVLEGAPWLVQAQVVPVIVAHGEDGRRLLARGPGGMWRSGAVRWIRELAPAGDGA